MKVILTVILGAFFCIIQQGNGRLNGKYRVEFDKKYALPGYQITFNDSIYRKVMADAVMYKGRMNYGKYVATIRRDAGEDLIEIDNREFNKDTIKFITRSKTDISRVVNRGRMIKVSVK